MNRPCPVIPPYQSSSQTVRLFTVQTEHPEDPENMSVMDVTAQSPRGQGQGQVN